MPKTPIRGVELNYQIIGEEGPWVTLITGGRRGHDEFIPLAGKIAARGHRVLLHDRRNTGASDILMLRSGAVPVMLVVADQENDSGICLTTHSSLNLFSGCWRGQRIYELSSLGESRVLSCVQAQDLESRF